jgi:hypothetical protein
LNLIVYGINTVGVLLSGGKSFRMGQDKAQVEIRGQPLIYWALGFLRLFEMEHGRLCFQDRPFMFVTIYKTKKPQPAFAG